MPQRRRVLWGLLLTVEMSAVGIGTGALIAYGTSSAEVWGAVVGVSVGVAVFMALNVFRPREAAKWGFPALLFLSFLGAGVGVAAM